LSSNRATYRAKRTDLLRMKMTGKAPEPTPMAVMLRATSRNSELKPQNESQVEARVTPAIGFVHP